MLVIFHIKCSLENNTRVDYNKRITWVIDLTQKSDPIYALWAEYRCTSVGCNWAVASRKLVYSHRIPSESQMRARNPATTHDQQLALSGKGSGRSLGGGGQGVSLLGGHSHPSIFFLQSFAFFSPPLTCRPHSRPAVRDTYFAGGHNVWNAGAMQVSPLMTPSPHSPWRPPTPPALAHTSYLSEFWQCQPEISAPYPSIILHINSPQLL